MDIDIADSLPGLQDDLDTRYPEKYSVVLKSKSGPSLKVY